MSSSMTLNDIYFEEFLEKQGKVKAWSWRKHWFVLEGDQLGYYKDKEKINSRGLIDLALAKTVRVCAAPTKGFPFEIVTSSRSHVLSARTVELRDKWVELCEKAMLLSFRRSRSMHRPSCDSISDDDLPDSVLEDLQNAFSSDSRSPNNSGHIFPPYSQSTPNTPVAIHPSRASRSHSNEEQETPVSAKTQKRRMCRKTKSEFVGGGLLDGSQEKMLLKKSQSNTSSSSMSTEDDEVFAVSDSAATHQVVTDTLSVNHAVLRRKKHTRDERSKGMSNGTNSSSSLRSNKGSSVSSTSTIADDSTTVRESNLSCSDTVDDIPDDIPSSTDVLEQGPLSTIKFTVSRIPSLPYPRLELVNKSIEDLRGCIARIRKPDEVFAKPHPSELGGKAMAKLKNFLNHLDGRKSSGVS